MPTDPRDAARARHDQQQTPGREAWFQGSRIRLDLNVEAAVRLRDALDYIIRSDPSSGAALARSDMRLPDGRPLHLSVRLTDAGTVLGRDGTYRGSDGVAYVDVSGDFDNPRRGPTGHRRSDAPVPRRPTVRTGRRRLDAARVDQVLDGRAPTAKALEGQLRDAVRARAQRTGDKTRGQRIADVVRRQRDVGISWDQ